jgi:hypothetical protein
MVKEFLNNKITILGFSGSEILKTEGIFNLNENISKIPHL